MVGSSDGPRAATRPLGFVSLLALGINGVVGVGIFFAPARVAALVPGYAGVVMYLLTALAMLPIALGYAALGGRFDVDGGPYVWASAAFGERFGFLVGWITYVSSMFSVAAVVSGLAHHAAPLFGITGDVAIQAFAVASTLLLAFIASTGLRPSAIVWTGITAVKLIPLFTLIGLGLFLRAQVPPPAAAAVESPSAHAILRAVLIVVFASQGFEIVPLLAGSVRSSARAVPVATVTALVFASVLYAALHAMAARAVFDLGHSAMPLAAAASAYGGEMAGGVVAAGANLSALGIAFGMMNTTPRYLSALAGPGSFGPWIGATDARFVPQRALFITVLAVVAMVSYSELSSLFVLSSLAVLAQYGAVMGSLAVLALRRRQGLLPRHAWPVPLSAVAIAIAAAGAEAKEIVTAAAVVATGFALRHVVTRRRSATAG